MKYLYLFLAFNLLMVTSCEEINELETVDELSVQGYLQADKMLPPIQFKRVVSLNATEALAPLNDLSPIIITEDGQEYILEFLGEDGLYGNANLLIEAERTYTLEVAYNGKTIRAITYVPEAPQMLRISDQVIRRTEIRDFSDLQNITIPDPIQVDWMGQEGSFYFVQVENIEEHPDPINQLFADSGFERPVIRTEPSTDLFYLINAFQEITFFGRYQVVVYRVNPEYVTLYESNEEGSGVLNQIQTNIENGYGIFTGVNQATIEFEVRKQ